ncbi:hypothetical protein So717_19400 [Roseobacter cerasinus]|uniref:Transposase IS30-like HTH domain-containing protein n=1 Tax=Roseobacter cerasinus TaxID=2602289 RepID=A0A640VQY3_9RHOB|nr:hypothetical protein So717_19400 [Roseobacter cerasinus]
MELAHTELDLRERRAIEDMLHAKVPVREMARFLKRHKSTISREIKRNFLADDAFPKKYAGYFDHAAQLRTDKRRSVQHKLIRHSELRKTVVAKIKQSPLSADFAVQNRLPVNGTPEQIGNRIIYEGAKLRVCQETIYRYIYSKEGMDQELWRYLPGRKHEPARAKMAAEDARHHGIHGS